MASESYERREVGYLVARTVEEALGRVEEAQESTAAAWADLGYWEREEHAHEYSVYEVELVKKVTRKS
jgi:hypothetical protein